jgi:hypothetical protein
MSNPSFRRILLIGLGGSGQKIVLHLKRRFLETYGVVPPSVKMLCLDTDAAPVPMPSASGEKEYRLDPHEFIHIKVDQPEDFIKRTPHVDTWFVKPMPAGAITAGAGAVRQNGRLGLFHHLTTFLNRVGDICIQLTDADLNRKMTEAGFELSVKETEIYVCGSLAGGTGSGTFLDVGILLRDMMPRALIHGFFMLDWLYRRNAFALRVGGNVYAALAELDDLQSITYGSDTFVPYQVDYGRMTIRVEKPPYTLFHLIDGRNEVGENIADPGKVAEMIASAIYLSVGELGPSIASVVDNLVTHIGVPAPRVWEGKYARYSSLGVSCMCYPAKALHRRLSAEQALRLCEEAIVEAEKASGGNRIAAHAESVKRDVDNLVSFLGLSAGPVVKTLVDAVESKLLPPDFGPPTPYEVSDSSFPALLEERRVEAEAECDRSVRESFTTHAIPIIDRAAEDVAKKVQQVDGDRSLSVAQRQEWKAEATSAFRQKAKEATEQLKAQTEKVADLRARLEKQLQRASGLKSSFFRNPRMTECQSWAEGVRSELLPEYRREAILKQSAVLFERLIAAIPASPAPVVGPSQASPVIAALRKARDRLRREKDASISEIDDIKKKTNHILLADGKSVIPKETQDSLGVDDEIREERDEKKAGLTQVVVTLHYDVFKRRRDIKTSDDYLAARDGELWELFMDYSRERTEQVGKVGVEDALKFCAHESGRSLEDYTLEQFNHLFRLASPLWCYSRSLMDAVRQQHYDRILNIGVAEKSRGEKAYEEVVKEIKVKYGIAAGHTFNTTRDPERIWLLGYAASLPAYFVQTLQENLAKYEEEISPPYHVDKYFETEVPDIFPVAATDNIALRVLGMAIVPDIDLIHDEKQEQGHSFSCRDKEVIKLNSGDEFRWLLFRDMYRDVRTRPDLRQILAERLKERVDAKSPTDSEPLKLADLKNVAEIVGMLRAPASPGVQRVAAALPDPTRAALAGVVGKVVPMDLQKDLLRDLNERILKCGSCFLAGAELDDALGDLRKVRPVKEWVDRLGGKGEPLEETEFIRLNRLLLQRVLSSDGIRSHIGRSVRSAVEDYVAAIERRLEGRDFTRLISARLTYREVSALKAFLTTKPGGYSMNVDRYIAGR